MLRSGCSGTPIAVFKLLGLDEFVDIFSQSRSEFMIGIVCLLGVLILGPLGGLLLAFVLALIHLARRASQPEVTVLAAPREVGRSPVEYVAEGHRPRAIVFRFAAPLFFANGSVLTSHIETVLNEGGNDLAAVILDAEGITDVDVTGAEALRSSEELLRSAGVTIAVSRLRPGLRDRLRQFGLLNGVHVYETNREALDALNRPEA